MKGGLRPPCPGSAPRIPCRLAGDDGDAKTLKAETAKALSPPILDRYERPLAVALAILAALLYVSTLGNGYVFDDLAIVFDNPVVTELRYGEALAGPYWPDREEALAASPNWRPLATVSFLLERHALGRSSPTVHHALNALLHGLVVLALFPLARRLAGPGWPALAACALFGAHPAHAEVVAPVVGRTDLLAALGGLLALNCFLRYRGDGAGGARWLGLGAAAYALALASKESAAPVLLLLPAADWLLGGRRLRALVGRPAIAYLPFLAVALVYVVARIAVLGEASFLHTMAMDYTLPQRLLFAARNAVVSAGLLLAPTRFHHILTTLPENAPYTYPDPTGAAAAAYALGGIVAALGWLALVPRAPRGAFLWLAALAFWLPTSGLLPAAAGVSLRFLFLPTAFLACGIARALERVHRARPAIAPALLVAVVIVSLLGAAVSARRCLQWRDNGTFFSAVVAEAPRCFSAQYSLGSWYALQTPPKLPQARTHYAEAVRIAGRTPAAFIARLNLGACYGRSHSPQDLQEAVRLFRELLEDEPQRWEVHWNIADVLQRLGKHQEALEHYERTLELHAGIEGAAELLLNCAAQRERLGDTRRAEQHYRRFLARYPDHPERDRARQRLEQLIGEAGEP
jgi:tetratricopeptide (TPR) repeat protein